MQKFSINYSEFLTPFFTILMNLQRMMQIKSVAAATEAKTSSLFFKTLHPHSIQPIFPAI